MVNHPNRGRPRPYFVLVERDNALAPWAVQFGALDRGDVEAGRQDRRDHGAKASNLRIHSVVGRSQRGIDTLMLKLNAV